MEIAKITSKGQVTIPIDIRKSMNLEAGDKIIFVQDGEKYYVVKASSDEAMKGVFL